jgi:hypothetical protein
MAMKCLRVTVPMLGLVLMPVVSLAQERVMRTQVPAQRVEALDIQTEAISGWWDEPISLGFGKPPPGEVVGKLELPEGSYVIIAKSEVIVGASAPGVLGCRLTAGGSSDEGRAAWEPTGGNLTQPPTSSTPHTLALTVVHTFASPGTVWLQCWGQPSVGLLGGQQNILNVENIKMTAIRIAKLTTAPMQVRR